MAEKTVPRVARSVDDLRVGQVIAWPSRNPNAPGSWETGRISEPDLWADQLGKLVILSDPPPSPVVLSAEAQTALDVLRKRVDNSHFSYASVNRAARAFLAAVDEGVEG